MILLVWQALAGMILLLNEQILLKEEEHPQEPCTNVSMLDQAICATLRLYAHYCVQLTSILSDTKSPNRSRSHHKPIT